MAIGHRPTAPQVLSSVPFLFAAPLALPSPQFHDVSKAENLRIYRTELVPCPEDLTTKGLSPRNPAGTTAEAHIQKALTVVCLQPYSLHCNVTFWRKADMAAFDPNEWSPPKQL